jgi:PadR family transcriptional regulator, regulatory protein PadR
MEKEINNEFENSHSQMRKGTLEFSILLVISQGEIYASDILKKLKAAKLIVVEGTLYPILNRLKRAGLLEYNWKESKSGPPRKYYKLTKKGESMISKLKGVWKDLSSSIESLL